jgi:hypothetical protein
MDKIKKLLLTALIASTPLLANEKLASSMLLMEDGITMMQKGFLHNQQLLVDEGLRKILEGNKLFKKDPIKTYLPKDKQHMVNMAKNTSIKIDEESAKLQELMEKKEYRKATESFSHIINACTGCHSIVRNW